MQVYRSTLDTTFSLELEPRAVRHTFTSISVVREGYVFGNPCLALVIIKFQEERCLKLNVVSERTSGKLVQLSECKDGMLFMNGYSSSIHLQVLLCYTGRRQLEVCFKYDSFPTHDLCSTYVLTVYVAEASVPTRAVQYQLSVNVAS